MNCDSRFRTNLAALGCSSHLRLLPVLLEFLCKEAISPNRVARNNEKMMIEERRLKPRLLVTLGDVAGIGPEIVAKSWPQLIELCRPVVIGDSGWLRRGLGLAGSQAAVRVVKDLPDEEPRVDRLDCIEAATSDISGVTPGRVCAEAGRAAYDFLCRAIDLAVAKQADAIVTAPLHKEGLKAAGLKYPGHTEILAERTRTKQFAMLLWGNGVAVAHVTLHMALRDIFSHLTPEAVLEKINLLAQILPRLLDRSPRIGVAALNPHASDGGLFGDEEERIIRPAVLEATRNGIQASGPWPADTLFVRAHSGEFDGVVAMYHDEGHIAMKLRCGWDLVNISAGPPIVRTSVAHGTAYDIAGKGIADPGSLIAAAKVAARLAQSSR